MVTIVDTISTTQLRPRHPEKVNRPDAVSPPKPDWIRVRAPNTRGYADTRKIVKENGLVTVCEEAGCPNIGECWDKKHATFMIMGDTCTRACSFCNVRTGLPAACKYVDKGSAGLVTDLKARGLLDSTVVHWGGEMGRLPTIQNDVGPAKVGRDHNTYGFSMWVAGGGFKQGFTYGETDEFGHHAVKDIVNHYDYHATLLHLFGLDYQQVVFKRNGTEMSLVDGQNARLVSEILRG